MKEAFAVIGVMVTVGIALAGLMFSFQSQTNSRLEQLDNRVYEMNERLTRIETRISE